MKYQPDDFSFDRFRVQYVSTSQYDPFGDDTRERLLAFAYIALHSEDEQKAGQALADYKKLVADHLAHIGVVSQVLGLAEEDQRLGSPEFFRWMRAGLVHEVLTSGDGRTLAHAYDVMTFDEETMLIAHLGLKLIKTETRHSGRVRYNMHSVEDRKTGQRWTLFVDATYPLSKAEYMAAQPNYSVDLRRR